MKNTKRAQPISGVLGRVISSLGLTKPYGGWLAVSQWSDIVGPQIAQRAKAIRFNDGVLYVAVPDPSWRQELSMQREDIIHRIQSRPFGKAVKEVRLIHSERRI